MKTFLKFLLGRGTFRSYSQFGEDGVVRNLLPKRGIYIDVGCYHPHLYSNTYALYRRGWSGICIDPNPKMARLFKFFRPRDTFICAAVGKQGSASYEQFADGRDAEILQTYDWRIKPTVIIAETDFSLADKGYRFVAECGASRIWQLRDTQSSG